MWDRVLFRVSPSHLPRLHIPRGGVALERGVGARKQRRRDFRTAVLLSTGLWLVCEIIVDIGAVHEMSIGLLGAAATLGAPGFSFTLGLLLGALVCRLLRRKQLA